MGPTGVLNQNGGTSFARYAGILIVFTLIGIAVAQLVGFLTMELCNPIVEGGELLVHKGELVETCVPRLEPGGMAAWSTAIGGTLGATAGWFYRENKRAASARS